MSCKLCSFIRLYQVPWSRMDVPSALCGPGKWTSPLNNKWWLAQTHMTGPVKKKRKLSLMKSRICVPVRGQERTSVLWLFIGVNGNKFLTCDALTLMFSLLGDLGFPFSHCKSCCPRSYTGRVPAIMFSGERNILSLSWQKMLCHIPVCYFRSQQ